MKTALVITALLLFLGGGGYWYLGMYQPQQFAKAVLALEDELKSYGQEMSQPRFRWRYDYETAMAALDKHEAFFSQWVKKIKDLNPPILNQEMKALHENLLLIGIEFPKGADRAKKAIAFTKNAIEVYKTFNPTSSTSIETLQPEFRDASPPLPPAVPYDLGTAVDQWKSRLAAARPHADNMFSQEPLDLDGNTFGELKSLWEEINKAADTVLPALEQKFGRSKPLRSLPPPAELEKTIPGAASLDKIDKFLTTLEGVIIKGGAEQILASAFNPPREENLQRRSQSMSESLRKLREQYGK